ncbi:alpha/beta hydrolase [Nonomuraea sp. NEAU-L178]|nr:alpha/beta hydrolase [Nonomuraea aurantiaca]
MGTGPKRTTVILTPRAQAGTGNDDGTRSPCAICSPDVALRLAAGWQLDHVSVGSAGHINSASRLGRWDFGRALLTAFTAGTRRS